MLSVNTANNSIVDGSVDFLFLASQNMRPAVLVSGVSVYGHWVLYQCTTVERQRKMQV